MTLITDLRCVACDAGYPDGAHLTCPACGPAEGILDVRFDLDRAARTLTRAALADRPHAHWRYRELLPLDDGFDPGHGSLATIGWTPIVEAPRLAASLGLARLRLKDEGRSASASFKDRASSVGVAHALQQNRRQIACASTGNAASSLAHCAAAAGLQANIFVSQLVPAGKLAQLLAYGARVFRVQGTYAQAYDLCTRACERFGWYNRNAAINPYLVEGKKTGGLELAEQCAADPPEWVACSVGDGCSIAGVQKGLAQMKAIGLIPWDARMLGVQAAGVAPIFAEWRRTAAAPATAQPPGPPDSAGDTYADSINVAVPRNRRKALNAIHASHGTLVTVTDEQIMAAVRLTGRLSGIFAEPAAAAAVAGIAAAREQGLLNDRSNVLAMITGNGLKDTAGALRALGQPHDIPPELERVAEIVAAES